MQLLCNIVLHSSAEPISHSAITFLHKLSSLHMPSSFAHCIPIVPLSAELKDHPKWLRWEANGRTEVEAKRQCGKCKEDGVWGLIWVRAKETRRNRDSNGNEGGVGDEGGEEGANAKERVVSEMGWEILHWLVTVWEKDQVEHAKAQTGQSESPSANSVLSLPYGFNRRGPFRLMSSLPSVLADVPTTTPTTVYSAWPPT